MAEFGVHGHYNVHRAPTTADDVRMQRWKTGQCPDCGTQTHAVKTNLLGRRSRRPLTNEDARNGRCLACHPSTGSASSAPGATAPTAAAHVPPSAPPGAIAPAPGPAAPIPTAAEASSVHHVDVAAAAAASTPSLPPPAQQRPCPPSSAASPFSETISTSTSTPPTEGRRLRDTFGGRETWGTYRGEMDEWGRPHGRGSMEWDNGNAYQGDWRDGMREGRGTMQINGRGVYEGEWKGSKMEGHGTMRYVNGSVYEGEWRGASREGHGTFIFAGGKLDGIVYEGGFRGDDREGTSVFRWPNGMVEVGRHQAGKPVGEGVRWSADRRMAARTIDGTLKEQVSLMGAKSIADRIGLPVLE